MARSSAAEQEELQRRRQYAQEHFGGPGTDRGKAYVKYGPPDEIESHTSTKTDEWHYKDSTKTKVKLALKFQDGKLVSVNGGAPAK